MNNEPVQMTRPAQVRFAAICMAANAGLQILHLVLPVFHPQPYRAVDIVPKLAATAATFLFAWLISQGKNWARWVFVGMILIGLLFLPTRFEQLFSLPLFRAIYFWFGTALEVTAAVLLVVRPSNEWFRGQKGAV